MITYLHVRAITARSTEGIIICGHRRFPCVLGKNGSRFLKREGDGASPYGIWQLGTVYFRIDRLRKPETGLCVKRLHQSMGWCDAVGSQHYNRLVRLPQRRSHEILWREDCAYDIVIPTNHNQRPRIRGHGSAIFFHLTKPDSKVTAGCVAVEQSDMVKILRSCSAKTKLIMWPATGHLALGSQK